MAAWLCFSCGTLNNALKKEKRITCGYCQVETTWPKHDRRRKVANDAVKWGIVHRKLHEADLAKGRKVSYKLREVTELLEAVFWFITVSITGGVTYDIVKACCVRAVNAAREYNQKAKKDAFTPIGTPREIKEVEALIADPEKYEQMRREVEECIKGMPGVDPRVRMAALGRKAEASLRTAKLLAPEKLHR
ncbi:hypothetical protein [Botrimarina sp.]|uniref:hypothetical protein n=1 Tax=Botrimarina sp. TaxID=2795802 RepID=UPI0032EF915A